jgi:hypothetical protein
MDNKSLAPICLFVYNRLSETKQTVTSLQKNFLARESELFIFSDGPKTDMDSEKVNQVREYIKSISGFKNITLFESPQNKGLANSIISGVTQIIEQYGKIIVLEDDLILSANFLDFMNAAILFYQNDLRIQSISAYSPFIEFDFVYADVFFHHRTFPWGWATWKNRWNITIFDKEKIKKSIHNNRQLKNFTKCCGNDISKMLLGSLNGINNSWYVRWVYNHYINNTFAVFPVLSKVANIGFTNNSTHCSRINTYKSKIDFTHKRDFTFDEFYENACINAKFLEYFKSWYKLKYRIYLLKYKNGLQMLFQELHFLLRK